MRRGLLSKVIVILAMALTVMAAAGQENAPPAIADGGTKLPPWDVISVHPVDPQTCTHGMGSRSTPDGINIYCVPLLLVIRQAYSITEPSRILNAPDWVKIGSLWNIDAKVSGDDAAAFGKLSVQDRGRMLQAILSDRFHMKAHTEQREMPVYDLVVAKGGPKLKEPTADEAAKSRMISDDSKVEAVNATLAALPWILNGEVGRPVIDKTGLTGKYDYTLQYVPAARAAKDETGGPSIFTALEEQLGLKLAPAKEMMDVLVIDSIERSAGN